ncbi:DUF397 domain-containing protein [Actinomadura rugatobispora]|uniref:DUF397 domain-containing protein n=1 Tax=Actinomadura rugatobispora TaxID=1994 RepID=A0ABW0ZT19_9ACTN|nr:hypothetical protein GCM10010200_009220 [Actinomadura rugatobispora]
MTVQWRKSSYSGGAKDATCVEVASLPDDLALSWRKSSYSGGSSDEMCVEVAGLRGLVGIRDSKDPDGDRLAVSGAAFGELVKNIKDGALDRA